MPKEPVVTIAERIRATSAKSKNISNGKPTSLLSLDEQIAALEGDSSTDSSDSDEETSTVSDISVANDGLTETDSSGRITRLVSSLAADRIAPLPSKWLPGAKCGAQSLKPNQLLPEDRPAKLSTKQKAAVRFANENQQEGGEGESDINKDKPNEAVRYIIKGGVKVKVEGPVVKRQRSDPSIPASSSSSSSSIGTDVAARVSGMEAAVRELLKGYEPASIERRPFWCRICRHQATDEPSLRAHRESEFHQVAVRMEAKAASCQLCRKQFTSPAQLKEHLNAKAHKQRLEFVRHRQIENKKFC